MPDPLQMIRRMTTYILIIDPENTNPELRTSSCGTYSLIDSNETPINKKFELSINQTHRWKIDVQMSLSVEEIEYFVNFRRLACIICYYRWKVCAAVKMMICKFSGFDETLTFGRISFGVWEWRFRGVWFWQFVSFIGTGWHLSWPCVDVFPLFHAMLHVSWAMQQSYGSARLRCDERP